jgi:hypothetical protein
MGGYCGDEHCPDCGEALDGCTCFDERDDDDDELSEEDMTDTPD